MSGIKIREMTPHDYEQSYALWKRTEGMSLSGADSKERIAAFLERNRGLSLVCELDGGIIGTILCGHDSRRAYIYHVAVDKCRRRQGTGSRLVSRCLEKLRQQGIARCHIFVFADNEEGMSFWRRTGWRMRKELELFSIDL